MKGLQTVSTILTPFHVFASGYLFHHFQHTRNGSWHGTWFALLTTFLPVDNGMITTLKKQ